MGTRKKERDGLINMKIDSAKDIEDRFKTLELCRRDILCDFFKYAFDGSGADNFFDAGSCIDGRLTSGVYIGRFY